MGDRLMSLRTVGISIAAMAIALSAPAIAQDQAVDEDRVEGNGEEILVTGFRGALASARQQKKDSDQIIDVITAEDIGQFPDENVAESLSRVTGIQIDRSAGAFGEGAFISIRGLGPDATRTFVNGRAVLSTRFADRSVDFRDLPADFVQSLEVIKSPAAATIDGSLGGVVNVVTRKPLDGGGGLRGGVTVQGGYADLLDEVDPFVAAIISNSWNDNTIGITLSAQYQQRDNRQDSFDVIGYDCRNATNLNQSAGCADANAAFLPRGERYFMEIVPSERIGLGGTLQWRPTPELELTVDGLWNQRKETTDQIALIALTNRGAINPASVVLGQANSVVGFTQASTTYRVFDNFTSRNAEAFAGGINLKYRADRFLIDADFGYSRSDVNGDFDQGLIDNTRLLGPRSLNLATPTGVPAAADFGPFNANSTASAGWFPFQVRRSLTANEQEDIQYRVGATIALDDNWDNTFEFGVRYSDASFFAGVFGARARSNFFQVPAAQRVPFANPDQFLTTIGQAFGVSNFGTQLPGSQIGNFVLPFIPAMQQAFLPANFDFLPNAPDTATIDEETLAGYGQFNFSVDRFSGNIGVRIVRTDIVSRGEVIVGTAPGADLFSGAGVTIEPIEIGRSYTDVLPSANFRYDLIPDELLVRAGASRTLFRPEPDELAVRGTLNLVQMELVTGNPRLDPFRSTNFDASMEYYFGTDGLLSFAVFYKDIESFISTRVPTGATFITEDGDEVVVVGPANGAGGKLHGFEIGLQTSFADILPAPFDGLGIVANYTFIDDNTENVTNNSTGEAVGLAGVSRHSYNLIGFYEKGPFSGRLAYNWRSSFLQPDRGSGELNLFTDDFGTLDGRLAFQVLEPLEIYFEAKNITNEKIRGFAEDPGRVAEFFNFGRRFFLGAQYTF